MIPIYVILGLFVLSLIVFLILRDKKTSILAIGIKTLTSILFIATGLYALYYRIDNSSYNPKLILIISGLIFGLIGDIILDFKTYFKARGNIKENNICMHIGLISFALGHICYLLALFIGSPYLWMYFAICLPVGVMFMAIFVLVVGTLLFKMDFNIFKWPSILYGGLLTSFFIGSLILLITSIQNNLDYTGYIFITIASGLFLISDMILSLTYFSNAKDYQKKGILNPESRFFIITNHVTYYAAQILIAVAILFLFII